MRAFFVFGTKVARYSPFRFIAEGLVFIYHLAMEQVLQTLREIGVPRDVLDAIRDSGNMEYALILMMDDDRHEYVD